MRQLNIFETVKQHVTTRQAASFYGFKVNRGGMMCCPFHDDKTPSMKVDQNFICFGCQEKGDVIRFVSLLFHLSAHAAAQKLADDLGLDFSGDSSLPVKSAPTRNARRKTIETGQLDAATKRVYEVYCDYLHLLNRWAEEHAPRSPDEEYHPLFVEAMHKRDHVNYLLGVLFYGSEAEKVEVVIENGKGVKALERRIAQYKCGKAEYASCSYAGNCSENDRGTGYGTVRPDGQGDSSQQCGECGIDPVL